MRGLHFQKPLAEKESPYALNDFCSAMKGFFPRGETPITDHNQPLTRVEYSPERVSMVISSPSSTKGGMRRTYPVSTVAGL